MNSDHCFLDDRDRIRGQVCLEALSHVVWDLTDGCPPGLHVETGSAFLLCRNGLDIMTCKYSASQLMLNGELSPEYGATAERGGKNVSPTSRTAGSSCVEGVKV